MEELIIESDYAHPEKCKIPGCEEFIMVAHSWGRWKVEYLREYNVSDSTAPVHKNWNANEAKTMFNLVTNGSALEWGCTIPEFSTMGAPGGGRFFFEPVYAGCDHSGGTTVLNAKAQICDRKGYTGDTACANCGHVISAGSDIYPPANAGHTGPLQPLYYYGTNNSATTDASHGGNTGNTGSSDNNTHKPRNDDSTKCPQTGDNSNHMGWLAALYVSGGVLTLLGVSGKKRKRSEVE